MDVSRPFPPSPAFSDCDSLAGIDDLDAFLDAQGKLSQWPTPPMKREMEEDLEVPSEESDYESEDGVDGMQRMLLKIRRLVLTCSQILILPLSLLASCVLMVHRPGTTFC